VRVVALLVGLLFVTFGSGAHAEDIGVFEVEGDSDAGGADPRVAALDEAFARAVSSALGDVLDSDVRNAHKQVIDREILGRARLWIAKFTVNKDETSDGRRQLSVTVRVDRDKMRARLGELNIGTHATNEVPANTRTGVILLRIVEGERLRAAYGATAEKDIPGLGALASVLRGGGFAVKRAPAGGASARPGGQLPLDDDEADTLAGEAKTEIAAIAGVTVGPAVPVRGVATSAALVTAHVRVIGRGKKLIGQGVASVAARGIEPSVVSAGIDRALVAAASDAVPAKQASGAPRGFQGDDTPVAEPGVVLVRLSPKTPYALVAAELKHLGGAKGVSRAVLRRMSPGGWVIGVTTTESVQRISNIARKAPTADSSAQVKIVGQIVELALTGSP
jgi:hypothetical protein